MVVANKLYTCLLNLPLKVNLTSIAFINIAKRAYLTTSVRHKIKMTAVEEEIRFEDPSSTEPVPVSTVQASTHQPGPSRGGDAVKEEQPSMSKRGLKRMARYQKFKQERKSKRKPQVQEKGFGNEYFNETSYYFENGLRKVYPYYYSFTTYAKQRWYGQPILEVFEKEFMLPENYNAKVIGLGNVTVNGKPVTGDYKLKDNDFIAHQCHRHENPVADTPIEIISNTNDVVVINKPASIPCHPCGRYRYNSVVFILGKEFNLVNLRNIYRLDRLTSGLLIMAKTNAKTKEMEDDIAQRRVEKEYVCRVVGKFPDGIVDCEEPLDIISQKIALRKVSPQGKPSHTTFERLSFNGTSSVVKCIPHTGRTHQIRVHLQYLGHPIVNDPFYNSDSWGPNRGKGGLFERSEDEIVDGITKHHNVGLWMDGTNSLFEQRLAELKTASGEECSKPSTPRPDSSCVSREMLSIDGNQAAADVPTESEIASNVDGTRSETAMDSDSKVDSQISRVELRSNSAETNDEPVAKRAKVDIEMVNDQTNNRPPFELSQWYPDKNCEDCRRQYIDPQRKDLTMYLHALRYKGPKWEYKTEMPEWAKEDWNKD